MDLVKSRRVAVVLLATAFILTGSPAFSQRAGTSPPAADAELRTILDAWAQRSARTKTLSAKFRRFDKGSAFGAMEFLYDVRWRASGQAVIDMRQTAGKDPGFARRILWTGREVWEYLPYKKQITVTPLSELAAHAHFQQMMKDSWGGRLAGNQLDLIFPTLSNPRDVDPLPFLVGMNDTVAQRQFRFELLDASDPKRPVLRATPLGTDPKPLFKDILITFDRERCLPVVLEYQRGWRSRDIRQFTLLEIEVDAPLADSVFEPQKLQGWQIEYESPSK